MQLAIAALGGLSIGALAYGLMRFILDRRPAARAESGEPARRLQSLARAVPVPARLVRRWDRPEKRLRLVHAGLDWDTRSYLGMRWAIVLAGLLLAAVLILNQPGSLFRIFVGVLLVVLSWWAPMLWLQWRVEERLRQINHGLPDLMDRLRLGLEAGLGFELALRRTVHRHGGLLGDELKRLISTLDRGHTKEEALARLTERNPSPDLRAFAAAVKQAEQLGTSLAKTLQVQGELLRARRRRRAQEASRRLPILIVFPLVFFFLPALLIVYLGPPLLHLFMGQ
ncbi:MAG: type II secretion system F family protein [Anaerolineales bacterium]